MDTTMLLCDYAETVAGKLYILGGGWSVCTAGPRNMSIAAKILVPWDETNEKHQVSLSLQDSDGNIVALGEPPREVVHKATFTVGRPPLVPKGMPIDYIFTASFFGLPVEQNQSYRWQLEIDNEPVNSVSFITLPEKAA